MQGLIQGFAKKNLKSPVMQKRLTDCRHDSKKTSIDNLIYKNLSTFAFPKE